MLELELIDAVSTELKGLFLGYTLLNSKGVLQAVKIFRQYIPQPSGLAIGGTKGLKGYGEDDYAGNFPCLLVKYQKHTDREENRLDQSLTELKVYAGVYDETDAGEGWRDVLEMLERVRDHFLIHRVIGKKFMLGMPLTTHMVEEDTWPVYFGEMDMIFTTGRPVMGKDFVTKEALRQCR